MFERMTFDGHFLFIDKKKIIESKVGGKSPEGGESTPNNKGYN